MRFSYITLFLFDVVLADENNIAAVTIVVYVLTEIVVIFFNAVLSGFTAFIYILAYISVFHSLFLLGIYP